jgi:predicted permease
MEAVASAVLPLFALILAGVLCARFRVLGPAATDSLNNFVVWLALPALLFQGMAGITWDQIDHPGFLFAFAGSALITFVLAWRLDRRTGGRLADRSIEGLGACYANTGFMGVPLCLAVFGPAGLPPAILSTLLTACVLFAGAIVLIEMDVQQQPSLGRTLRRVGFSLARNPLLIAPVLGLLVASSGFALPGPVRHFTTLLGDAASPCALVTIGLFLAQSRGTGDQPTVVRLVVLKLLINPAITAVLACFVFSMPALWSHTAVLLSALPIGTGPFMLAKRYERAPAVTSRAILFSTVVSVVTISVLVAVLG